MIYIVRHGQTDWNGKKFMGHTDIPLNQEGRKQSQLLADKIYNINIKHIFSSDLLRARETAEIIGKKKGIKVILDKRLREHYFGDLEGTNLETTSQETYKKLQYNPETLNAESFAGIFARIKEFFDDLKDNDDFLVVTHGDTLRMIMYYANNKEKFDLDDYLKNYLRIKTGHGKLFEVELEKPKKLCVFAGTFDPMSLSHKGAVEQVIDNLQMDKVLVAPKTSSRVKTDITPLKHRNNMINLTIKDIPKSRLLVVNHADKEFHFKCAMERVKYDYPESEIFYLRGADTFISFYKNDLKLFPDLASLGTPIIITRGDLVDNKLLYSEIKNFESETGIKSVVLKNNFPLTPSTSIRDNIWNNSNNVKNYVHPDVYKYIIENDLYRWQ
jgi:nicotinate (nicotinamide) nucleotide adenylyltransferase